MSAAAPAYLTEAEIAERRALLHQWGLDRPKSADVVSLGVKRKPLGLAPIVEPDNIEDEEPERDIADPPLTRPDDRPATLLDIDYLIRHALRHERKFSFKIMGEVLGEELAWIANKLREEFAGANAEDLIAAIKAEHRTELAELKLTVTELRCEVASLRSIQENARTLSRGEQGLMGPRGIPGPPGARGERGERGEAGSRPAGFVLDLPGYAATLVSSDGAPAARLAMRPLFEKFAEEINGEDE